MFTALEEALTIYSDMHKDVYGFRPRGRSSMTLAEVRAELDYLQTQLDEELTLERELEEAAVARIMSAGAPDRDTALRWMDEAYA